jgi:hypothetical protein
MEGHKTVTNAAVTLETEHRVSFANRGSFDIKTCRRSSAQEDYGATLHGLGEG